MNYRYLGRATPRIDAREVVTGSKLFLDDVRLPGMLIGKALRSPLPHAEIREIDVRKAKEVPGVHAVLTYMDVPPWKVGMPRHYPVLGKRVRYVGDPVALVAAETEEAALEALDLIRVEYEPLPAVFDPQEALKPGAVRLYEEFEGNEVPLGVPWFGPESLKELRVGDPERGFSEADVVVEGCYSYESFANPLPPEPPGAIALWEDPGTVRVWLTSQGPYFDQMVLYYLMDRKYEVKVVGVSCGGSYGSKGMIIPIALRAILLARASGRPVKFCLDKGEHLSTFTLRLGTRFEGRVGMKGDGRVTAISGSWIINTGCYSAVTQAQVAVGLGEAQIAIRCPNWDIRPKIVLTNRQPSGWIRGFGGQELKAVLFPLLHEAMARLDIDPVEFIQRNFVKPGDGYFWRDGRWWTYRGVDFAEAIRRGAEAFGWKEKWKGWLKPSRVEGSKRVGVGVGVHGNADVGEDVSEAYLRIDPNFTVTLYCCVAEQGGGQRSNLCKMVAEVLKIPLQWVRITPADATVNPYEYGLVGSRGTYAIGSAVIRATEDARRKLLEMASRKLGLPPDALDTEDGVIFCRQDPSRRLTWREAMGVTRTLLGYGRFEPDFSLTNFLVSFVELQIDIETGRVELLRVVNATDVGQVIDPLCLQNQLNGCLGSAGIDSALFEETVLDPRTGRVLNPNMIDYRWRTFLELPDLQNVILETPFPSHRFGAVGVGEIATSPGPAAVLMAASNALGRFIRRYPLTPDRILEVLKERSRP